MSIQWVCHQDLGRFERYRDGLASSLDRIDLKKRTFVGRYQILDREGDPVFPNQGTFKKIYFCVTRVLESAEFSVFIAARSPKWCTDWVREKRVLTRLNGVEGVLQPLLIKAVGRFEYLISELFNCGSLYEALTTNLLRAGSWQSCLVGYAIVSSVLNCHAKGVILRDLKPENILVKTSDDGNYIVRLIDFGIAFIMSEDSKEDASLDRGTLGYIPPEGMKELALFKKFLPARFAKDAWVCGAILAILDCEIMPSCVSFGQLKYTPRESFSGKLDLFQEEILELLYSSPRPDLSSIQARMRWKLLAEHPSYREKLKPLSEPLPKHPKWETEELELLAFLEKCLSEKESPIDLIASYWKDLQSANQEELPCLQTFMNPSDWRANQEVGDKTKESFSFPHMLYSSF